MSKTAQLIKPLTGYQGQASLYKLDPPMIEEHWGDRPDTAHEFVIVSAADVMFSGPETYIFPATEDGEIASWGELEGSFKGALDHAMALEGAGYTVV